MSSPPSRPPTQRTPETEGAADGVEVRGAGGSAEPAAQGPTPALLRAVDTLLRPLVRLLIARQVTYPVLIQRLKQLYVDVAQADLESRRERVTDSRLTLMTGVHRKDIRRLSTDEATDVPSNHHIGLGGRLVARWSGDAPFLDPQGEPLPLPRSAPGDGRPSFESLVAAESKDIRARAVLDEWQRLGLVTVDEAGLVHLRRGGFVPDAGKDEQLHFLGRNVRDHLATAAHNVLGEGAPLLERSLYASGLSTAAVSELAQMAEERGMETLRALNRRVRELKQDDAAHGRAGVERITLGIYFYTESEPPTPEGADDAKPD